VREPARAGPKIKKAGGISRSLDALFYQNNITENRRSVELTGPTGHHVQPPYVPGPEKLPLALQDHNHPVRYRNMWLSELK